MFRQHALLSLVVLFCFLACSRHEKWTTPSGLQVIEIKEGQGSVAKTGDIMSVLYTAWYLDGAQFDSYQDRSSPYRFRLGKNRVLPGFDEGVATMRPGGKRILIMPPELAFGREGRAGTVPPNTWVKLEVELISIEASPPPPEPWNDAGLETIVTDSGLQYVDFVIGDGPSPTPTSLITVHYSGFLDDGTLFDSTYLSGVPITFALDSGELIAGWLEGVMSMQVGGSRKLIIPPFLAYGDKGFRDAVPPNATLTYDIQLLAIR